MLHLQLVEDGCKVVVIQKKLNKTKIKKMHKALSVLLLLMGGFVATASAQSSAIVIRGNVSDPAGKGLAGVSVNEKGTNNGTTTSENGSFVLRVGGQN